MSALFCALLILPAFATLRLSRTFDPRFLTGYAAFVSGATYLLYRADKKRAKSGAWRVPEAILHWAEFFGGWPGAFIAQQTFRHKTVKISYQINYWIIVTLHQFVSFDFLHDWEYSRRLAMSVLP